MVTDPKSISTRFLPPVMLTSATFKIRLVMHSTASPIIIWTLKFLDLRFCSEPIAPCCSWHRGFPMFDIRRRKSLSCGVSCLRRAALNSSPASSIQLSSMVRPSNSSLDSLSLVASSLDCSIRLHQQNHRRDYLRC